MEARTNVPTVPDWPIYRWQKRRRTAFGNVTEPKKNRKQEDEVGEEKKEENKTNHSCAFELKSAFCPMHPIEM